MPTARLIPNVERRLSAWVGVQERLRREPRREARATITISRQFGCEAYPLAELLSKELGERTQETWTIFDEALINRVNVGRLSLVILVLYVTKGLCSYFSTTLVASESDALRPQPRKLRATFATWRAATSPITRASSSSKSGCACASRSRNF